MDSSWSDLLGQAVSTFAQGKGVNITSDQISSIAQALGSLCANMVDEAVKKQALADANESASKINTLEDAEAFERTKS